MLKDHQLPVGAQDSAHLCEQSRVFAGGNVMEIAAARFGKTQTSWHRRWASAIADGTFDVAFSRACFITLPPANTGIARRDAPSPAPDGQLMILSITRSIR